MTRLLAIWSPIEFIRGVGFLLFVFAGLCVEVAAIYLVVRMFD